MFGPAHLRRNDVKVATNGRESLSHPQWDVKPEVRFPDSLTPAMATHFSCFSNEQSCLIDARDKCNVCITGLQFLWGAMKSLIFRVTPLKLWPLASHCGSLGSSHACLPSFSSLSVLKEEGPIFEDHTGTVLQRASGSTGSRVPERAADHRQSCLRDVQCLLLERQSHAFAHLEILR